jgi:acylpyruvate hydrolase
VAGYSVFNDASIRDYQLRTPQWTAGKNFDDTGAFGPWLVTPEELPAGAAGLKIECRLNGNVMQSSNTNNLIFSVANTIHLLSTFMTLAAGDVLVMGTPGGVGVARKPQVWMQAGDVCEIEIEGVGLLVNPIVAE